MTITDIEQKKIFSKNLNKYLNKYSKSQKEVADAINVSPQTFNTWCQGIALPRMGKVQLLADYFHIDKSDLIDEKDATSSILSNIYPIELKRFPMLGEIACGKPIYANEDRESYIMAGTDIKADFCLKAKGDSMINARICDGDIVFIRQQDIVENGEIAAVVINNDNEATLKRFFFYAEKNMVILKAENPAFEDMIFLNDELNNFHVLGKAVAFQSDVK